MAAVAIAELLQRKKPGDFSGSLTWASFTALPGHNQRAGLEVEQPAHPAPIWIAGTAGSGLAFYATAAALSAQILILALKEAF